MTIQEIYNSQPVRKVEFMILDCQRQSEKGLWGMETGRVAIQNLLSIRKTILNEMFVMDDYYLQLLKDFNEAMKQQMIEMRKRTITLYESVAKAELPGTIEVEGKCYFGYDYPPLHPIQDERAKRMWDILNGTIDVFIPLYHNGFGQFRIDTYHSPVPTIESEHQMLYLSEETDNWNEGLDREMTKDYYYRNVTPEREALSAFELLLFLFALGVGIIVLARNMSADRGQTVIGFLFTGKWTHGLNIFSLAAIFFLFCMLFLFLALLKAISAVLDTVLSKRALTISSLVMNILFYASVIAFIFISLGCLGVNAKALIASAGFVGLAVSMSFRDIISDVLAGIMIITSRTFEVGDYIEIRDASSGTVRRMGLRKTELISDNGKTFSIRNSQISKVTNHSRMAEKPKTEKPKKDKSS